MNDEFGIAKVEFFCKTNNESFVGSTIKLLRIDGKDLHSINRIIKGWVSYESEETDISEEFFIPY